MKYHGNEATENQLDILSDDHAKESEEILKAVQERQIGDPRNPETPIENKYLEEALLTKKRETGMMIQIISHENGNRSEPFIADFKELGEILNKEMEKGESNIHEKDFILLVAIFHGEETKIPTSPIITVETFLKLEQKECQNA